MEEKSRGRSEGPEGRKSDCPVDSRPTRLPGGASRKARGFQLAWTVGNRGAPDWAGAATRLPGAGRRGPICRGTNRVEAARVGVGALATFDIFLTQSLKLTTIEMLKAEGGLWTERLKQEKPKTTISSLQV